MIVLREIAQLFFRNDFADVEKITGCLFFKSGLYDMILTQESAKRIIMFVEKGR